MEEQPYLMICDTLPKLEDMRKKMVASVEKSKNIDTNETQNRYNDDDLKRVHQNKEVHDDRKVRKRIVNLLQREDKRWY